MALLRISQLPIQELNSETLDNCFYVDKMNSNQMNKVPMRSVFDWIKEQAIESGLDVVIEEDRIRFLISFDGESR